MGITKRNRVRSLLPLLLLLLTIGSVLLVGALAEGSAQQSDDVEVSIDGEHHSKSGADDSKLQEVDGTEEDEEEEEFDDGELEEIEVEEDDEDEDEDEEEEEEYDGEEDEEGEDEEESDFDGQYFEDEFEGEDGEGVGEEIDETDVVVLGSGNFSEFVNSNHYVMVEFYAPWCGHCQALAPEYAEAATILKGQAVLAKVDSTAHEALSRDFSVVSYPTLFLFIDGVKQTFSGHRKRDEIVEWVKKKMGPPVASLVSRGEAELMLESQKSTMVVALLSSLEGSEAEEYASAARQEDDILFYQFDSVEVAEAFDIPKDVKLPALVLLKQEPEKVSWFDGPFKRDAIAAFVAKNKFPLIIPFSKENSELIFGSSIRKQIILFAGHDDFEKLSPAFKEASSALIGELVFVYVDLDDSEHAGIVEFFGLSGDKPVVMGYETEEHGRKFLLKDAVTAQNVKAFGEDFLSDTLKPHLKSAPIPDTNDEDVKTVVGLNLDDIVLDETKDVFLEIYAPWCGHCQALDPIWNKLAKRLSTVESIVIAKMDGTANEHDRAKQDGFPTLLFFPAGRKSFDPVTFDGDRTMKEFLKFLKKEAAIPFTVPKKPDSQDNGTASEQSRESASSLESKSTTISAEAGLESIIEDSLNSRNDEL